jgi:hypothetical protein
MNPLDTDLHANDVAQDANPVDFHTPTSSVEELTRPVLEADGAQRIALPPGVTFPVRVRVRIPEVVVRDEYALSRLNSALAEIDHILRPPPPAAPPDFDDPDDFAARIAVLDWITAQVGVTVDAKPGQYVLGTVGRILGVGDDPEELHNRVFGAEPELASKLVVGYRVTDEYW